LEQKRYARHSLFIQVKAKCLCSGKTQCFHFHLSEFKTCRCKKNKTFCFWQQCINEEKLTFFNVKKNLRFFFNQNLNFHYKCKEKQNILFFKKKQPFTFLLFHFALVARKNGDHFDFTDATMVNQKLMKRLETVSKIFFFLWEQTLRKNLLFFFQTKCNVLIKPIVLNFICLLKWKQFRKSVHTTDYFLKCKVLV